MGGRDGEMIGWIHGILNEFGISAATAVSALVKAFIAGLVALAMGKHGIAFGAFLGLMFVDTITKWYAMGRNYVANTCNVDLNSVSLWSAIKGIYQCWGVDGYLCASEGRRKWSEKMWRYIVLTIGAALADILVSGMLPNDALVRAVWFYFGINEAGSILNNLKEAGISQVQPLCDFYESKKNQLLNVKEVSKKEEKK